ncbi:hypothetical protein GGI12_003412, partial [Dipsacomyces acuminosporus]
MPTKSKAKPKNKKAIPADAMDSDDDAFISSLASNQYDSDDHGSLLSTPTPKHSRAQVSHTPQASPSPKSSVFVDILVPTPSPIVKTTRGQKRKSSSIGSNTGRRTPAKQTRSSRYNSIDPDYELETGPALRPKYEQEGAAHSPSLRPRTKANPRAPAQQNDIAGILSPSKFVASRARISSRKQAAPPPAAAPPVDGVGLWRRKYEELFNLRQTKPEADYEEFKASAEERFSAADELIKTLRKENNEFKKQVKAQK